MGNAMKRLCWVLTTGFLILVVVGCASAPSPSTWRESDASNQPSSVRSTESVPASTGQTPSKPLPDENMAIGDSPEDRLSSELPAARAAEDLALRLGVGVGGIIVMSIQEIEIPVTDFGCPGGPKVTQAGTSADTTWGEEIVLSIGGSEYAYRAHGSQVVLCRPPAPFADPTHPPELGQAGVSVNEARSDLSRQLGVDIEIVEVLAVESVEWPDSSLGCPAPGMMYAQVITPGYRILLSAGGRTFEYHGDERQALLCQP